MKVVIRILIYKLDVPVPIVIKIVVVQEAKVARKH